MANNCLFDMKITGPEESIKELVSMLKWEGKFKDCGLGRVYSFDVEEIEPTNAPGISTVNGYGDCAWSVLTAMQKEYRKDCPSLEGETARLGLVVEVFSSEPGIGFQEHVLISKGDVIYSDCVDYEEHWIECAGGLDAYNKENGTNFTAEMINESGDVCIGGFGDKYGVFEEDVTFYFVQEQVEKVSLVRGRLDDAVAIEYKGILFDNWTVDEETGGIWGEMCQGCADKYKDVLSEDLSDGGVGACSVKGCDVVGADSDNERHYYVDFKPEFIRALTEEQLYFLYPEQEALDDKIAAARIAAAKEEVYIEPDRNGWDR